MYRGYVYDDATALYYLQTRYYRTQWNRFINCDMILGVGEKLLDHNTFSYCHNAAVISSDHSGCISVDFTKPMFKGTYYISGDAFWGYMKWQFKRHKKPEPKAPIIESLEYIAKEMAASRIVDILGNIGDKGELLHEYGSGILAPFLSFNYRVEGKFVEYFTECISSPAGYKAVKIEVLYGTAAEARLSFLDQHNNLVVNDAYQTYSGFDVALNMMEAFEIIASREEGATFYYEPVNQYYTLEGN